MRIAVVAPPIRDFYLTPHRLSALGARIVADLCRERRHEVKLFLFPQKERSYTIPLPEEASHLLPYMVPTEFGPLSFFTRFQHFGPPFEECGRRIYTFQPDAVFLSSFAYAYAEEAVALARVIRSLLPTTLLAVGGAGPSSCPEYYTTQNVAPPAFEQNDARSSLADQRPLFDYVAAGEGEVTVPLLLEKIEQLMRKKGSSAEGGTEVIRADHLCRQDELTGTVAIVRETSQKIWATTSLSRGCPKGCRFCSNYLCHGREFRMTPLSLFERAIRKLPPKPILYLNFEDDNLLCAPEYFFEVLKLVKSIHPSVLFSAENGLDYLLLDPSRIDQLIQYGFHRFNLSLGTIYWETAFKVDRPVDLSHYLDVVKEIHNRGASSITYFIAGLEADTPERIVEQIQFLQPLPTLLGISLFYPVPGIPGFSPPPALLQKHPGSSRGSFAYPWTGSLTTEELVTAFRLCRYVNLLKKEQKTKEEEALIQEIQRTNRLLTFRNPSRQGPARQGLSNQSLARRKTVCQKYENFVPGQLACQKLKRNEPGSSVGIGEVPANLPMVKLFFSH